MLKKKLILRYTFLCIPMVVGGVLFSLGIYNIVSSLLFFVGGYIFLKNVFDIRKVNRNKDDIKDRKIVRNDNQNNCNVNSGVVSIKRTYRRDMVKRRIKK